MINSNDLIRGDMVKYDRADGSSDLLYVDKVKWLPLHVRVKGFSMMHDTPVTILSPFNEKVEVWNA